MKEQDPSIAVIGGGTGSFTLLNEFKEFTPNIAAIVNMSDDGGHSGELRDEFGVLPPGDVRQCLVALSRLDDVREMFSHRFEAGSSGALQGRSLGNLVLSGLEQMHKGDFMRALSVASKMLNITGEVIPVTTQKHTLMLRDGPFIISGESNIANAELQNPKQARVFHEPGVNITAEAEHALSEADIITIAPGNYFGSILPALAVGGMSETLRDSKGKVVMVANLVNKPGQTPGWHVNDYVEHALGYINRLDYVVYNTEIPAPEQLRRYVPEGEVPVRICEAEFGHSAAQMIGADLVLDYEPLAKPDVIERNLIRHDAKRLGQIIMQIAKDNSQEIAA